MLNESVRWRTSVYLYMFHLPMGKNSGNHNGVCRYVGALTTPSFCGDRVENWIIFQPNHSGRIFVCSRSDLSALLRDFFLLLLPHCAMYTILYMCAMPVCQKTAFPVLCVRNFTTSSALQ